MHTEANIVKVAEEALSGNIVDSTIEEVTRIIARVQFTNLKTRGALNGVIAIRALTGCGLKEAIDAWKRAEIVRKGNPDEF